MAEYQVLILVKVLVLASSLTILAQAQPNYEIVAVAGLTPTIDGIIGPEEWNDANYETFDQTTVFVKQDGVNLYIAFNITDSTYSEGDDCGIAFDVNHDESPTLQTDDILISVMRNGSLYELNVTVTWNPREVFGWTAEASSTENLWQSEFNITYSKLNITAGTDKIIGALFGSLDMQIGSHSWPQFPANSLSPGTWGNVTPDGYNWIPEFSNIIYIILFLASPLFCLLTKRRKPSAHT
jgi:hypothetical protein